MDKGKRVVGDAREKLAAELKTAYESGASIRSLADSSGRSYGFVHDILTETGVCLRRRGAVTRARPGA